MDVPTDHEHFRGHSAPLDHGSAAGLPHGFARSAATPLYGSTLIPESACGYVGVCILLIALGLSMRLLTAAKHALVMSWKRQDDDARADLILSSYDLDFDFDPKDKIGIDALRSLGRDMARAAVLTAVVAVDILM